MADPGRLTAPPIQEALVDLRIVSASAIEEKAFEPVLNELRSRYPKFEWRHRVEAHIQAKPGQVDAQARDMGFYGLFLQNASHVAQFRPNGFTLSQLAGYTTGDDLFSEALSLWEVYTRIVQPSATIRIALRYLNRLLLPFRAGDDFARFLTAPIAMPPGTPQEVGEFLTRTVVQADDDAIAAIVTQRLEPGVEDATPFVLDIDVFKAGEFSTDVREIESSLQSLRRIKNQLFFAFLTDEALEPYR